MIAVGVREDGTLAMMVTSSTNKLHLEVPVVVTPAEYVRRYLLA